MQFKQQSVAESIDCQQTVILRGMLQALEVDSYCLDMLVRSYSHQHRQYQSSIIMRIIQEASAQAHPPKQLVQSVE